MWNVMSIIVHFWLIPDSPGGMARSTQGLEPYATSIEARVTGKESGDILIVG